MKKLLPIVLLALPLLGIGQNKDTLAPTLVSTAGGYAVAGGISLSYSVGEPITPTFQDPAYPNPAVFYLTQGFEQPQSANALNFYLNYNNESCIKSNDGSALVNITGGIPPYSITWSGNATDNGTAIDSLQPGTYTVTVKDRNGLSTTSTFVILASTEACEVKFYNGITPNGDGKNDEWVIQNIEIYPDNDVQIYNRWGTEVWSAHNYDNNHIVWKGNDYQNQPLPDGTYFYLVTINGAAPLKGWVQLTR
jgi:gliding motility-associated-like protein